MTKSFSPTIDLAQKLIERPSVTPEDHGCQALIAERLEKIGFTIHHLPFGEVQNLWAVHGDQKPLFVYAGHTDVVPTGNLSDWTSPPFTPSIRDGYLYGRGAADMKGSIAAMVTAAERFIKENPKHIGSIAFLITSDEEGPAKNGTAKVMEHLKKEGTKIDYCLVGEPSSHLKLGDTLKIGRRGSCNCTLKILGKQGHVAYPEKANNPIHTAVLALAELTGIEWDKATPTFPATSFQISNIQSGTGATNVIPGSLDCKFNFRFNPDTNPDHLIERIETVLRSQGLNYELHCETTSRPFLTESGKLLSSCIQAVEEIVGITPTPSTIGGTSDGRYIAPTGAEVIELGPNNHTIHCVDESVNIEELDSLSKVFERILQILLSNQKINR